MRVRKAFLKAMGIGMGAFALTYFIYVKKFEPNYGYVDYQALIAEETTPEAIMKALRRVEYTSPMSLNDRLWQLERLLFFHRPLPDAVRRDITVKLTGIYRKLDDELTNSANKKRIIEIIGAKDNSAEAHQFFMTVLEDGPAEYREHALGSICHIQGDDIYDKVKDLMRRGVVDPNKYYYAVVAANRGRALPEILETIRTTDNPKTFTLMGKILGDYRDVDLMDTVIDRYPHFTGNVKVGEPAEAISSDMLCKYMSVRDGDRFRIAMGIFKRKGMFSTDRMPILQSKLSSADVKVREDIIEYLNESAYSYSVTIGTLAIFQEAEKRETDKLLKLKIQSFSEALKAKVERDASQRELRKHVGS